ncbi:MAG TPA: hypothetical protein PKI14_00925, partial [Fervidobacterium sp.]|nr:hypothetical protein [Fervidobacterium sp.]
MSYNGKTNWQDGEIVHAQDMNRIEQGILDAYDKANAALTDYAQHGVTMGHENDIYVAKIGSLFEFTPLEASYGGNISAIATDDNYVYV